MPISYISSRTTAFHGEGTNAEDFVLIYGDEVDAGTEIAPGRTRVIYRGRPGWVASDRLMLDHPLELYFIDVGQGDAAFIVSPAHKTVLIDGGRGDEAFQFLVWKYRLDLPATQPVDIDLLVVSHVDDDHLAGLAAILLHPRINVRRIIHSGIAKFDAGFNTILGDRVGSGQNRFLLTRHDGIADLAGLDLNRPMARWRQAVVDAGTPYAAVDSSTGQIDIGDPDVGIAILGPILSQNEGARAYRWLGSEAETVNGHSVVLRLDYGEFRALFPGDVNELGGRHLMSDPAFPPQAAAHLLKAPHHGSHEFDPAFLAAIRPQISVISSGDDHDHGHPRPNFLGSVGKASRSDEPLVYSTELVANFVVDADAAAPDADAAPDPTNAALIGQARRRFKKRLNGLINVRTDGHKLFSARRVAASYQFVTFEQVLVP
jgi:competence protein ComEC